MHRFTLYSLITATALLSACASQPKGMDKIRADADRAALTTPSSGASLIKTTQQLATESRQQETLRFAPVLTEEAGNALDDAMKAKQRGKADDEIRTKALLAQATYRRAIEHTGLARETLAPSLAHLEVLNEVGSPEYYPSDYQQVTEDLNSIIRTLERTGEPASSAQTQRQLLENMHDLEVKTVGFKQLQDIRNTLASLKEENAEELIPQSFAVALQALAAAEDLIATSPRATGGIATLREQALNSAAHATVVMTMVNDILKATPETAESLVLRTERWLYNISTALKFPDIRHLPMDEQSRQLADGVEELLQR